MPTYEGFATYSTASCIWLHTNGPGSYVPASSSATRPDRADRIRNRFALRHQHIYLAQLHNDLVRLVSLPRH